MTSIETLAKSLASQKHNKQYNYLHKDVYNPHIKTIFLEPLQINTPVEVFRIYRKNSIRITKRTKINGNGFVCPRFLREINVLKQLSNPPIHMRSHPGRKHIVKILDVYEEDGYLYFDMNVATGTLNDIKKYIDIKLIKEKILIDISKALQYIHDMGFNHYDLSHNNIAYIESKHNIFEFILIDFGNSVHKDRPLTIELSTCYTMSVEMIEASIMVLNYENLIKDKKVPVGDSYNTQYIEAIRKQLMHRKSDIWSIGSLSYYLHTYDLYVGNNCDIKDHYENLIKKNNYDIKQIVVNGNKEIITKTQFMLMNDYMIRPIVYFSNIDKYTLHNKKDIDVEPIKYIYDVICHAIIKDISRNMINNLDHQSYDDLFLHSYMIENKIKSAIIKKYNIKIIFLRTIILWLVSHIFMNMVWSIDDVSEYLIRIINMKIDMKINKGDVNKLINMVAFDICDMIGWNFEI